MEFNTEHPKVLLNFSVDNPMTSGFFVHLQDKVPFMDCVGENDSTETWVEHTQRHGLFDFYFHLLDHTPTTTEWLKLPIYHHAYYIDTRGEVLTSAYLQEQTTPHHHQSFIIKESTHEELWDTAKRRYLQRPDPNDTLMNSNKDHTNWRKGTVWE